MSLSTLNTSRTFQRVSFQKREQTQFLSDRAENKKHFELTHPVTVLTDQKSHLSALSLLSKNYLKKNILIDDINEFKLLINPHRPLVTAFGGDQ